MILRFIARNNFIAELGEGIKNRNDEEDAALEELDRSSFGGGGGKSNQNQNNNNIYNDYDNGQQYEDDYEQEPGILILFLCC